MSSALHPQTDGQTEKANSVIEDMLRHFVGPYQTDWDQYISVVEFAMNRTWQATIQNTPFMLNYGQNPNTPQVQTLRSHNRSVNKFIGKWSEQLRRAKRCIRSAQDRQKQQADKRRSLPPPFKPGDEVLVSTKHFKLHEGVKRKLSPRYLGPYKVLRIIKPQLAYELELPCSLSRVHPVFHVSSLRPYFRSGRYRPPPNPEFVDGEPEFEVDYIAATRYSGARREYKVYWVGYPDQWDYVHKNQLTHCSEKLKQFWDSRQQPCPHPLAPSSEGGE